VVHFHHHHQQQEEEVEEEVEEVGHFSTISSLYLSRCSYYFLHHHHYHPHPSSHFPSHYLQVLRYH